ncbi:MAG: MFS transporter, partial [Burkholderiales bacterium]
MSRTANLAHAERRGTLFAYGSLRLPLALAELPLFVVLPSFYGSELGLDLALVGVILFATRLVDALTDPLIGWGVARQRSRWGYRRWIWFGLPVLAIGFVALMLPPQAQGALAWWLGFGSLATYLAYGMVSIAYSSWGAELAHDDARRARVTATRESFGLVGVLIAATLASPSTREWLALVFLLAVLVAATLIVRVPEPVAPRSAQSRARPSLAAFWAPIRDNRAFRWLLAAFLLNGIATAIPATLVLFFVRDVLGAPELGPFFLTSYFLAAALGMPLWVFAARRVGLRITWLIGIGLAVVAFVWTLGLGHGDIGAFFAICVLTGLALGTDLAIPAAMLAGVIDRGGDSGREGAYFGIWSLATKLNLALAAGLALPLLDAIGYVPTRGDGS